MGATYTRQSSYTDGDTITAAHTNDEFNQLLAAFAASTGHTHDGTTAEGGPITKLLGNTLTFGAATAGTDITITFDGESNDGVLKWMEDEDYFEFSDDILIATTEKLQFRDTAIYINSSADGQLDLVADTEIQIAATTVDINGNVDISGTLTIGGAGISEAELEILDGATVTTTEINIMDGDTSASATTVADADRVVFNDAGTMKQVAVTDLAAYFDDEITAMPNLVTTAATTVGALNSGSITSGFGTIDTGSSTITTTGLISGGSLDIDNVLINGTTIGHTDDTDLMTVASGLLTVAGEVSMTTLDIGGTNVTSTAAELNYSDTGAAVGTVVASKVVTADANKDVASFRNITLTGELDAGSLDVSGDADIDGTLEADAITVNGTALNTVIAGVTVTDATNSAHVLVTDNESTNEENLIAFVEDATSSTGNVGLEMDGNFSYNPSTGTVSATIFKGNVDAVDGDFDGTLEADAITLDGTAITTVATLSTGISNGNLPVFTSGAADNDFLRIDGTSIEGRSASEVLSDIAAAPAAGSSNIVTTGALNSGSITSGFGAIDNGSSAITTTGVGSFGSLDISGDIDIDGTANLDAVDIDGAVDIAGNLTVDGGTIKLDGNYPTGSGNVALGNTALDDGSLSGANNTAIGSGALTVNTSGGHNVAVGANSLDANTTASNNTAIGFDALTDNTTGSENVAIGMYGLANNTTAAYNFAGGYNALGANTTGARNVGIGHRALQANTTGTRHVAVGYESLHTNTTGSFNTAVGDISLHQNTTGQKNTAVGLGALEANTTGSNNVAVGLEALDANTTGTGNFAAGYRAGTATTTGSSNTFVGQDSGTTNTTSGFNTYVGGSDGVTGGAGGSTTGEKNTFIGNGAGSQITSGADNTIIGRYNGNQNSVDLRTLSNNVVISDGDGNIILLYRSSDNTTQMQYVYSNTTSSAANVAVLSSGTISRSTSSRRYKNTINDATHGLTELLALRPVTFKGNNDGNTVFGGLIAEEVHDAGLTEFVQYNDDDEPDALAYGNMVSLCIKAIQEQQATITALTKRIEALEA